jgi:hypothetical protein
MNNRAAAWEALSGEYRLSPGQWPSIAGQRPVLTGGRLGRLLQGQQGETLGRSLSSVFTLCAHAHRRCAELALAATQLASGVWVTDQAPVFLLLETARDHLRSIALDWPQRLPQLGVAAQQMDWLRGCPLPLGTARVPTDAAAAWAALAALRAWLESAVLRQDAVHWLADTRHPEALAAWCATEATRLVPARCLTAWRPLAESLGLEMRCLEVLDDDAARQSHHLRDLARSLADEPDFAQRPRWRGECVETGPWSRLRHRHALAHAPVSAWTRLSARWLELVELVSAEPQLDGPGGSAMLSSGALGLGQRQALAWCEMARGLLLHWVQVDADGGVQDYRVLAPTEWNFHPGGTLAQALAALSASDTSAARTLAAAFDPCVSCTV